MAKKKIALCHCGSGGSYENCCQLLHLNIKQASNAEELMRSRFSAYALRLDDYIKNTWVDADKMDLSNVDHDIKWIRLTILKTWDGELKNEAFVKFEATYKIGGKAEKMHEVSRFIYVTSKWLYVDGVVS